MVQARGLAIAVTLWSQCGDQNVTVSLWLEGQ